MAEEKLLLVTLDESEREKILEKLIEKMLSQLKKLTRLSKKIWSEKFSFEN